MTLPLLAPLQHFVSAFACRLVGVLLEDGKQKEISAVCQITADKCHISRVRRELTSLMSSSLISRVISVLAFCTASSFAPGEKERTSSHQYRRCQKHTDAMSNVFFFFSLTHTFNSQVDFTLSLLGLFAWREIGSSDGDGSFGVFTDPLQSFFRRHLPPGRLGWSSNKHRMRNFFFLLDSLFTHEFLNLKSIK